VIARYVQPLSDPDRPLQVCRRRLRQTERAHIMKTLVMRESRLELGSYT